MAISPKLTHFYNNCPCRFAQFFISPAFSENCKDRELRAVDSEHKKNLQSDSWRLFQLEKNLSSPNHPYSQFGTGNLETLQDAPGREGIDVRDELIKFHSKYYSANIMKLVILGRGMAPVQLCSMTGRYEVSTFPNFLAPSPLWIVTRAS